MSGIIDIWPHSDSPRASGSPGTKKVEHIELVTFEISRASTAGSGSVDMFSVARRACGQKENDTTNPPRPISIGGVRRDLESAGARARAPATLSGKVVAVAPAGGAHAAGAYRTSTCPWRTRAAYTGMDTAGLSRHWPVSRLKLCLKI